jgi:hypothetical protein
MRISAFRELFEDAWLRGIGAEAEAQRVHGLYPALYQLLTTLQADAQAFLTGQLAEATNVMNKKKTGWLSRNYSDLKSI